MRLTLLATLAASVLTAVSSLLFANPLSGLAAANVPFSTGFTLDTSYILELLKSLLLQTQNLQQTVTPVATTTPSIATTTPAAKAAPAKKAAAPAIPKLTDTEQRLGIVLPSLRSALVNIICSPVTPGGTLRGISGTGVIIDPRGIILTAAHIGQYELLAEARPDLVRCTIRTGSPASISYTASPVYISSQWVKKNSRTISTAVPSGTGEDDYALLAITSSATSSPLPTRFPAIWLGPNTPKVSDPIVIGSYGAEFLTSKAIRSGIFPTLVYGSVKERFTFENQTVDLISLGGGAAAQEGSSGGGIANTSGELIGLITTSSTVTDIDKRDLRAITMPYLQRAFRAESGDSLSEYLDRSPSALVDAYADQAKSLSNVLVRANKL